MTKNKGPKKSFSFNNLLKNVQDHIPKDLKEVQKHIPKDVKKIGKSIGKVSKVVFDEGREVYKEVLDQADKGIEKGIDKGYDYLNEKFTEEKAIFLKSLAKEGADTAQLFTDLFQRIRGRRFAAVYYPKVSEYLDFIEKDRKLKVVFKDFLIKNKDSIYEHITNIKNKKILEKILLAAPADTDIIPNSKDLQQISKHLNKIDKSLSELYLKNLRKHYFQSIEGLVPVKKTSKGKKIKKENNSQKDDVIILADSRNFPSRNDSWTKWKHPKYYLGCFNAYFFKSIFNWFCFFSISFIAYGRLYLFSSPGKLFFIYLYMFITFW